MSYPGDPSQQGLPPQAQQAPPSLPYPPYYQPPYPSPYPPPPFPPRGKTSRWPSFSSQGGVFLYIAAPIMTIAVLLGLIIGISARGTPTPSATPFPTTALGSTSSTVPVATNTPEPTNTPTAPARPLVVTPSMGGPWSAFEDAYGPEAVPGQNEWDAEIAGQEVVIMVDMADASDTADGNARAAIINVVSPSGGGWGANTSRTIAKTFLPPDAHYINATPGPSGHTDLNYVSKRLANSLDRSLFTTDDGSREVTPGSVYWTCDQATGCYISVGTYN